MALKPGSLDILIKWKKNIDPDNWEKSSLTNKKILPDIVKKKQIYWDKNQDDLIQVYE